MPSLRQRLPPRGYTRPLRREAPHKPHPWRNGARCEGRPHPLTSVPPRSRSPLFPTAWPRDACAPWCRPGRGPVTPPPAAARRGATAFAGETAGAVSVCRPDVTRRDMPLSLVMGERSGDGWAHPPIWRSFRRDVLALGRPRGAHLCRNKSLVSRYYLQTRTARRQNYDVE